MIEDRTRLYKVQCSTWNVLLQLLRRRGASLGRSSRSLRTAGRLLRFTILCRHFLISQVQKTPARWRWPASLLTTTAPCQLSGGPFECYSSRFSCWERRSGGWHSGHRSLSSSQISFGSTTEAIPSCGPLCTAILPRARPTPCRRPWALPDQGDRQDRGSQAQFGGLHSWRCNQHPSIAGPRSSRIVPSPRRQICVGSRGTRTSTRHTAGAFTEWLS